MRTSRTRDRSLIAIATLTLIPGLVGCQQQNPTTPISASSTPRVAATSSIAEPKTATSSVGAPTAAAPSPDVSPPASEIATDSPESPSAAPGEGYVAFGHHLVKPNFDSGQVPWVNGPAELFVIGSGEVLMSAQTLLPGQEVLQESYTSIGSESDPLIAGIVQVREPAKGLEPEKYVSVLMAIDPSTQEVVKETEVSRSEDSSHSAEKITGSNGSAVAFSLPVSSPDGSLGSESYGFDALTGEKLWQAPGIMMGEVFGAVVLETTSDITDENGNECVKWTGTDIATGSSTYTVESSELASPCANSSIVAFSNGGGSQFLAEHGEFVRFSGTTAEAVFDGLTGEKRFIPSEIYASDALSNLVAGRYDSLTSEDQAIYVVDTTTGDAVWSLDAERVGNLSATVLALHDQKIYLSTTDQAPVVDIATGETILDDAARFPLAVVDSWTYWSDGTLEKHS